MARCKVIEIGKPKSIADLQKAPVVAGRKPYPRDGELKLLVNEVSAGRS